MPPRVEPWRDKSEMVRARTLYDAAHERGPDDGAGGLGRDLERADDHVGVPRAARIRKARSPREMIKAGLVSEEDVASFARANIVWRDRRLDDRGRAHPPRSTGRT